MLSRLIFSCAMAAALTGVAVAQEARPEPVLSRDMGALVVAAQGSLAVQDYRGAIAALDHAAASSPSPYELGVILLLRGGAKRQLGDLDGAAADWRSALAGGALTDSQRLGVQRSLAQLEGGAPE